MKSLRYLSAALCLVLLFGSIGMAQMKTPGVTDTEILIGSFQALSGPFAVIGVPMKRGMESYFNWLNRQGGVHGRKVNLIVEDDQLDPSKTVGAVKKLVERDGVFALVGGLGTFGNLAVLDYVVQRGLPYVYQGSGASALSIPPKKNVFSVQPNYTVEGKIIAEYAVNTLKAQRIGVIYEISDAGNEGLAGVKQHMRTLGRDLVFELGFNPQEVNHTPMVLRAMQARPDVVILYALSGRAAAVVKQSGSLGFSPTWITTYPNADLTLFEQAGPAWNGVIMAGWVPIVDDNDPDWKKCLEIYQGTFPREIPNAYAVAGIIAAEVFTEGLRRTGRDLTFERYIASLETLRGWNGIMAKDITYGPNERSGKVSMYFLKAQNNAFTTISGWVKPAN